MCECLFLEANRQIMYNKINNSDFNDMTDNSKFTFILKYEWKRLGKFLQAAWNVRSASLYS